MFIKDGVLGVESEQDFLVGDITIPNLKLQDNIIYEYNQGRSNDCTIYSAVGCISDLFNYKFDTDEIKDIVALSYKMGRFVGKGRYTYSGFNCVKKRWNEKHPDKKVMFFKVNVNSEDFLKAISYGYSIGCSYKGNGKYNRDFKDDGIVQGKKFGQSTYGHATRVKKRKHNEDYHIKVIDSYVGRKYNIYEIPNLNDLVDTKVFYPSAYIYVPEDKIPLTKEQLKRKTTAGLTQRLNSKLWEQTNKLKTNHEINHEEADDLQRHLHETNNVIRSISL